MVRKGARTRIAAAGELVFDEGMREIDRDIRILRAVRNHGTRYFDLLHLKVGNTVEVASSAKRLERAGFLMLDASRPLEITQEGNDALGRLEDPAAKEKALAGLFYGTTGTR
jgi:hypothetical protein